MRKGEKIEKNFGLIILCVVFLWGCATKEQYLIPPPPSLKHLSVLLHPYPSQGQSVINGSAIRHEKNGVVIEVRMFKATFSNMRIYVLKLGITNLTPSILDVDPKKVFARYAKVSDSFFLPLTNEKVYDFIKSYDVIGWPEDWRVSSSYIIGDPIEGAYFRKFLHSTQLPRSGSVEGDILFVNMKDYSREDDLVVQLYIGGEEFMFRFVEATRIPTPDLEQITDFPPPEEI